MTDLQNDIEAWFTNALPGDWLSGSPDVRVDKDEITVILPLAAPAEGGEEAATSALHAIKDFRERTRERRMDIADEAELKFDRKVAWGATSGETSVLFTHLAIPVMTRLRQPERQVLDTLVDAGVARSRADAMAWCVRLVGRNEKEWLDQLRDALVAVGEAREKGPSA
jgi:hypothetical protein